MIVRRSILAGLALLTGLGALQGVAALVGTTTLQMGVIAQGDRLDAVDAALSAQLAFERADRAAQDSERAPDQAAARALAERFRSEALAMRMSLIRASTLETSLRPVLDATNIWLQETDLRLAGSNAGSQTRLLRGDLLADMRDARQQDIARAVRMVLQGSAEARDAAARAATRMQIAIMALVGTSLIGGLLLSFLLLRRVLMPLIALNVATRRIAAGELDRAVEGTERRDEIGAVATALDALRQGTLRAREIEALAAAERTANEAHIRHLAHHDPLTGLANRTKLQVLLDSAVAAQPDRTQGFVLFCIDLDGFKAVNDSRGHAAGDDLLREVARRLRATVRDGDTVARIGGDEFVVIAPIGTADCDIGRRLAERIVDSLGTLYELGDGRQAAVTASVGVALFPDDSRCSDDLLAKADKAMYRVKQDGRNAFAFFGHEMDVAEQVRRSLEQDLRLAVQRGQLSLAYQPQVELQTERVTGFEVLLRWHHAEQGLISPDLFVPVAEASGSIVPIGAWVLRAACAEAMRWSSNLRIAVNVSPIQFQQCDMARLVRETLAATGLDPARLELEVTEGVLIRNPAETLETLRRIRELGVSISMDDFGTGYSSLYSLRAFPFDRLKIDRSFVKDLVASPDAKAIVSAVLGLARGLGLPVVAEGVEDREQLAILRQGGCTEVQGYLFGRPAPIEMFAATTQPFACSPPPRRSVA